MKKILSILATVVAGALCANAQFVAPPVVKNAMNVSTVVTVVGSSTSNLVTAALTQPVTIGANGVGIGFNIAGTNAATTTNCTFRFDVSADGVNWTPTVITVVAAPAATGYTPSYTNVLSTAANVGNSTLIRLASIQNTNLASIFITNLTLSTR